MRRSPVEIITEAGDDDMSTSDHESIPDIEPPVKVAGKLMLNAAWFRRLKLTKLLLLGGEDINDKNEDGQTALTLAILSNHSDSAACSHIQLVKYLLEHGADPGITDKHGQTALALACKEKRSPDIIKTLLENGGDPLIQDRFGRNALHMAAQNCDNEILDLMARHCKAQGKEVIIVTKKTAVVSPCLKDEPPKFGVTVQSAAIPPIIVKTTKNQLSRPMSEATLTVPTFCDLDSTSGRRCVYGSPRPKHKIFRNTDSGREDEGKDGDRRGSFTLSVNPIAEVNDSWIPREAVENLTEVPSIKQPDSGPKVQKPWACPKPPPNRSKLVRRATTLAISPIPPLPPPEVLQEGITKLDSPSDLEKVKSDLLKWEKELASRCLPKKSEKVTYSYDPKPSTSGIHLPCITGKVKRRGSKLTISRDSVLSSGEDDDDPTSEGGPSIGQHPLNKVTGKTLERKGSVTRLQDHLSQKRPGTLPPLNINTSRPVPSIDTNECEPKIEDGPPDAEGLTPHQRLLAMNPKRKFFSRRSRTIELADTKTLQSLSSELADYRRKAACHIIQQSSKEGENF